jgi:hypothetical protein
VLYVSDESNPARNGRTSSIGAGKTIVEEFDGADLEQRLQVAELERDRMK